MNRIPNFVKPRNSRNQECLFLSLFSKEYTYFLLGIKILMIFFRRSTCLVKASCIREHKTFWISWDFEVSSVSSLVIFIFFYRSYAKFAKNDNFVEDILQNQKATLAWTQDEDLGLPFGVIKNIFSMYNVSLYKICLFLYSYTLILITLYWILQEYNRLV